ncbi:MAG: phosphoribosyltransferase [Desulfurococcales archaeon ex4484_217_1]|nr:MAG: phosphoribosyltransferase [Desulfurococcales archaeon ex4484_217_1]
MLSKEIKLKFLTLTWKKVQQLSYKVCDQILKEGFKPDVIVGVMRGGWIPARIMLDILDVSTLAALEIKFYKGIGEVKERPVLTQPLIVDIRDKKVLIVQIKTAALVVKPWSIINPDFYALKTDAWVIFPWEIRETVKEILKSLNVSVKREKNLEKIAKIISKQTGLRKSEVLRTLKILRKENVYYSEL